jgi:hypothetical protein
VSFFRNSSPSSFFRAVRDAKKGRTVSQPHDDALILSLKISMHRVQHILVDSDSSADVMYFDAFIKMGYDPLHLVKVHTPLVGFIGVAMVPEGLMRMRVEFGTPPQTTSLIIDFLIVKAHPLTMLYWGKIHFMGWEPPFPSHASK